MNSKTIKAIGVSAAISALLIVPAFVFASYSHFNHEQSVNPDCTQDNKVEINVHFTNNEPNDSLNVEVKDNVSGNTIDMGSIGAGKSQDAIIATNQQSIQNGSVKFTITKDGTDDTDLAGLGYAASCGEGPTATPTETPSVTASPTPFLTSTPTETPVPSELIVIAGISNENGGTASLTDFTVHVSGADDKNSDFPAPDHPLDIPLDPGAYVVTETVVTGYSTSTTGDCSGNIAEGEQKTCNILFTYSPNVTPTDTPTLTPTPTDTSGNNNCDSTDQSGNNDNNNCNQQNQGQNQDQTQNNNQNVNITLNQPAPQILGSTTTTQLPSTGTPFEVWELLGGITPLGFLLRKITKK